MIFSQEFSETLAKLGRSCGKAGAKGSPEVRRTVEGLRLRNRWWDFGVVYFQTNSDAHGSYGRCFLEHISDWACVGISWNNLHTFLGQSLRTWRRHCLSCCAVFDGCGDRVIQIWQAHFRKLAYSNFRQIQGIWISWNRLCLCPFSKGWPLMLVPKVFAQLRPFWWTTVSWNWSDFGCSRCSHWFSI